MKNLKKVTAGFVFIIIAAVKASTPVEVFVPIDNVYSPAGFDSNDMTEVIVSGFLPNLCYKSLKTEVNITGNLIDIKVKSLKYQTEGTYCAEMAVPFVESVNVGVLDKGTYNITVNSKTGLQRKGTIKVVEAVSNAVDDYEYAGVEYIEKSAKNRTVKLKGYNPSDCFVLDNVEFIDNNKDVYSILPKMRQVSSFCPMKMVPFTYEVEVPSTLKAESVLLHARSMNGKSVNTLFSSNK